MKFLRIFFLLLCFQLTNFATAQTPTPKNDPQVDAIINYAKSFLGVPYRYGGTTPSGFDCSGFINYIFGNFGFDLVRTSYGLAELGTTVKLSEIQQWATWLWSLKLHLRPLNLSILPTPVSE